MCVGGAGFAARWRLVFGLGLGPSVAVTIVAAFAGFAPMFWNASGRAILWDAPGGADRGGDYGLLISRDY
jgi:hypothetical protein